MENQKQQPIKQIKERFQTASEETLLELLEEYTQDRRSGVIRLCEAAARRYDRYQKEITRIEGLRQYEEQYEAYDAICGIDEVGRGPLAGPVLAGAVILPKGCRILYINDSKQLSSAKREELYEQILEQAVSVGIGIVSSERIDEINILQATYEAMRQAIAKLDPQPDILLNDAVTIPQVSILQIPIIKGDAKSISIGAASIVAKVARDRLMVEYDALYPGYGFAQNKGYGSEEHIQALKAKGPCPIHRRSFLQNILSGDQ